MPAVLGIDAAWTLTQPSGIALAVHRDAAWHLVAVASSYQRFYDLSASGSGIADRPVGSMPDAAALLASAETLCGMPVDLVAIDMPLSHGPIVGRRASDNAVSRSYGARKCSTHTASRERPGMISDALRLAFDRAGYPLQTGSVVPPGIIEVYPHPALLHLADAPERLRYKIAKAGKYWPTSTPAERRILLLEQWADIIRLLDAKIGGVEAALFPPGPTARTVDLKAYEDMLDAVVCVWVAISALEGRARPFGDHESAIWIPTS